MEFLQKQSTEESTEGLLMLPRLYGTGSLSSYQELLFMILLEYLNFDYKAAQRVSENDSACSIASKVIQYHEWETDDYQHIIQLLEGWLAIHHAPTSPLLVYEIQIHLLSHKLTHPLAPLSNPTVVVTHQQEVFKLLRSNILRYVYYNSLNLSAWVHVFRTYLIYTTNTSEENEISHVYLVKRPSFLFSLEDLLEYSQLINGYVTSSSKGKYI